MADAHRDEGSWSRAFMASSGIGVSSAQQRHESPERHEAAGADLPRPRFAQLAHHRDPGVREALARRLDCPMAVLATLAHDARTSVRVAAAANPASNAAILEHLARDRDPGVLKAVARNVATPPALRAALARHRKADVRRVAERAMADDAASDPGTVGPDAALPYELRDRALESGAMLGDADPFPHRVPQTLAPRPAVGRASMRAQPAVERLLPDGPHTATT